jgi:tetratricopeptide (TPR) repeat protein
MPLLPQLALVLALAAVFGRAWCGGYVYDDLRLIAGSATIATGAWFDVITQPLYGPAFPHWRPLTQLLLAAGHRTGGAPVLHAFALLAHAVTVLVAYRLVLQLGADRRAAFLVALLFGVHPCQVESVAWCAALNDVLWGMCALGALRAHAAARARGAGGVAWSVVILFAAGLASKETALVIPLLLFAYDRLGPRPIEHGPALRGYWCLGAVAALWFVARVLVFGDWRAGFDRGPTLEVEVRAAGELSLAIAGRLLTVLLWPFAPQAMRAVPVDAGMVGYAFAALTLAFLSAVIAAHGRAAWRVALGLGIALLSLALPACRPAAAGEYPVADRYLYVAAFGLALALSALLRWGRGGKVVLVALALAFAVTSALAVGRWSTQHAFVHAQLAAAAPAHADARVLYMAGQLEIEAQPPDAAAARAYFARAAQRVGAPRFGGEDSRLRLQADIDAGLAWCAFVEQGAARQPDWQVPAAMFRAILARHENHPPAHVGLAVCLASIGRRGEAEEHLLRALELEPDFAPARHNLARLRGK